MPIDVVALLSQVSQKKVTRTVTPEDEPSSKAPDTKASLNEAKRRQSTVYTAEFAQKASRAGLLVTAELDAAIARCRTKVERIAASCRRKNLRFRDIEFDLEEDKERCLFGLNPPPDDDKFEPADVLRVSEIFDDPQFIIDGATSGDIVQGEIGNCWLLSALATVSTVQDLVERFCVARDEKVGVYGFIFWRDCGWVDVVIDDLLYISIPKYEQLTPKEKRLYHEDKDLFIRSARVGSKSLYFAKSGTENETWVPLVEKAFAKLHGDYASIEGGLACEGIEDLTGAVSSIIHTKDVLDIDRFWSDELMHANEDRLFGCYILRVPTGAPPGVTTLINGLIPSHAYSVIKAVEHNGKRFVRVRNPWGHGEWNGRWADGSKEWTKEWLESGALDALGHKFGDDGEFVMEYQDFLKTWTVCERSRLFDEFWKMSSLWLNVTVLPPPNAWVFGDVSFTFTIPARTMAVLVLAQVDTRYFKAICGYSQYSLEFVLFKRGDPEPIGESNHSVYWGRSVNLEIELDAGEYVVHVRLDRRMIRSKDYFEKGLPNWDWRKLGRVWSEGAMSTSIAENFNPDIYRDLLAIPLDKYAGQDLTHVELGEHARALLKREEKMKKFMEAKAAKGAADGEVKTVEETTTTTTLTAVVEVQESSDGAEAIRLDGAVTEEPLLASGVFGKANGAENDHESASVPPEGPIVTVDDEAKDAEEGWEDEEDEKTEDKGDEDKAEGEEGEKADGAEGGEEGEGDATGQDEASGEAEAGGEPETEVPQHTDYICDGCGMSPIVGPMYVCLSPSCPDYDLCTSCMDSGVHPREHNFMRIDRPDDMQKLTSLTQQGDDDDVVVGLRIYTHRDAPATIQGQLRHGRVVQWSKN